MGGPGREEELPGTGKSRRRFLKSTPLAGAAIAFGGFPERGLSADSGSEAAEAGSNPLCVFNKPLQHLGYDEQADLVAELGFDGIEGTVRKGGHVEPEKVEEDLPRQIEALRARGLEMTVMTTDVDSVESALHRKVLETAAALGVKRFRMGALKYSYDRPIVEQVEEIRTTFEDFVAFCAPLGLQPLYQNHAGPGRFGAAIWDLHSILEDTDPSKVGIAFDIRHATVEGGQSWPTEFHLVRPHFGVVYCKDFVWEPSEGRPKNVPLGTGRVDYPKFVSMLKKSDYRGPISLHMEYKNHRDPELLEESIAAIREDRKALLGFMKGER